MKQRLGIASAMLGDPKALILDEPANGLDPEGIRWMRDLLKNFAAEGRTVLVSSHLLSEMELLADDVVIIANGKLVTQGPVETIVGGMASSERVRVRTPDAEKLIAALGERAEVSRDNGALLLTGTTAEAVGEAALRAGVVLHELVSERPDLEQVFLQLTAGKAGIR